MLSRPLLVKLCMNISRAGVHHNHAGGRFPPYARVGQPPPPAGGTPFVSEGGMGLAGRFSDNLGRQISAPTGVERFSGHSGYNSFPTAQVEESCKRGICLPQIM